MNNYDLNKLLNIFNYWKDFTHPTEFYNEGWLTRILIFAVTDCGLKEHDLFIKPDNKYFSEPWLYSPFLQRFKKDPLNESFTRADSAIGNFQIGDNENKGALKLIGRELKIIEAKIFSEFAPKVTKASFYNQASRYIACIAKTIDMAGKIDQLNDLNISFYLIVPKNQYYAKHSYKNAMDKININKTVQRRVEQYKNESDYKERKEWFDKNFKQVLDKIIIKPIFYEDVISDLQDYRFVKEIDNYYKMCLNYNK